MKRLSDVKREGWNALGLPLETPFLEWDWPQLMEASGSTGAETGWIPCHLTAWSGRDLVAAAPLYVKTHSAGEFVFDHAWADVAERLNRNYYPKLVGMSPFTPMIGYRFLMAPGLDEGALTAGMLEEIERFCQHHALGGCGFHFVDPNWVDAVASRGFCPWAHQSFVWENESLLNFEDYLSRFNANQRRNIRRERRRLAEQGIRVDMIPGEDLPKELYEQMHSVPDELSVLDKARFPLTYTLLANYSGKTFQAMLDESLRDPKLKAAVSSFWFFLPWIRCPPSTSGRAFRAAVAWRSPSLSSTRPRNFWPDSAQQT